MATVNAQSVEDFADRIVYRFPAGRYEQAAVTFENVMTPGLKTLVNTDTSRSYVIPASGIAAKMYKIDWFLSVSAVLLNSLTGALVTVKINQLRFLIPSLNYDGRSLQTDFSKVENTAIYTSPQLRAINIGNISLEPSIDASIYQTNGPGSLTWNTASVAAYIVALLEPTVTFYKK